MPVVPRPILRAMALLNRTLDDRWTDELPHRNGRGPRGETKSSWREQLADAADLIGHGLASFGLFERHGRELQTAPDTLLLLGAENAVLRSARLPRDIVLPPITSPRDLAAAFKTHILEDGNAVLPPFGIAVRDDIALLFDLTVPGQMPWRQRIQIDQDAAAESPFGADATRIVHSALDRPGESGSVHVALIDRERIDGLLMALADEGLYAQTVTVIEAATGRIELIGRPDWLPRAAEGVRAHFDGLPRAVRMLVAALAVVTGSMAANLAVTSARLWMIETETAEALTAQRSAGRLEADARRIDAMQRDTLAIVSVLDALARTLPDGTWLDQIELNDGILKLGGYSPSAAETLSRIASVPGLAKVEQSAAVTRDTGGKTEKWRVQATIGRGKAP